MNKIQQIFNSSWAIGRKDYLNLVSIIQPSIKAGNFAELEKLLSAENQTKSYAVNLGFAFNEWQFEDENLPDNSIAVIGLNGILYSWESERVARKLELALSNSKIAGVIIKMNGMGGMVDGISETASILSASTKPIASVISGNCMSAHYWLASATERRFLLDKTCQVGSIGIVGTYYNATEAMKKEGIDYREIYPDTADMKNREFRDIAEKNDEKAFKEHLEKIHAIFCATVSRNLSIPYNKESPLFRGATFMGDEAIKKGLADCYGNIHDAARWVLAQSIVKRSKDIV